MAEFEAERRMAATADRVFEVVADLDRVDEWVPDGIRVRPTPDGEVAASLDGRGSVVSGLVRVRPEQLRLEWGSRDSPDYAGWLQVMHADDGHCSVLLHLSFLGDQPEAHAGAAAQALRTRLDDGLARLERLVTA
jgi:uncharacterized protein YndB with AHSA1/START domain